jgi:hypothetical protein
MTPEMEEAFDQEVDRLWRQLEVDLFLVMNLTICPLPYQYLLQEAEDLGISQARLYKARKRLGVYSLPANYKEPSLWKLPENHEAEKQDR